MNKFIIMCFSLLIASKSHAFEVVALSTKMISPDKSISVEAKVKNPQFKGKLKGIATLENGGENKYYIAIVWNQFINQLTSSVKDLDSGVFKSSFTAKSPYIKLNQLIEVSGDLGASSTNEESSSSQVGNNKSNTSSSFTNPSLANLGQNIKSDLPNQQTINPPKLESSSLACDPAYNFIDNTATMYYEDYYVKSNGDRTIKNPCHASKEVVKIQYEECDMLHEYSKNQSWRKRRSYIEPKEGRREVLGCGVYGNLIPHKFDESKCSTKMVDGEAVIYAKRYIVDPLTNQTSYISDCEPLSNEKIKVNLTGCSSSLFSIQNDAKMVYPAGRRYMVHNNKRTYLDNNCAVLLDYGSTFLTEHVNWINQDDKLLSQDWWHYLFDFTALEGGFKAVIENSDYIINTVKYKFEYQDYTKGHCGGWTGKIKRKYYDHYTRYDGSSYVIFVKETCS